MVAQTVPDRLLTIREVGERCNASPSWVRKAIKLGLMPYVDEALEPNPKRREPRIWASVVEAFIKSRERREPLANAADVRLEAPGETQARAPRRRAMQA